MKQSIKEYRFIKPDFLRYIAKGGNKIDSVTEFAVFTSVPVAVCLLFYGEEFGMEKVEEDIKDIFSFYGIEGFEK